MLQGDGNERIIHLVTFEMDNFGLRTATVLIWRFAV